jgi:RNA polymerase sigma factor for flagellar operon FliA
MRAKQSPRSAGIASLSLTGTLTLAGILTTPAVRSHERAAVSEFELRELWRHYGEDDQAARERLILNYAPLVKLIAGRLGSRLPSHVEEADLISFGLTGLLRAIERYDPERGVRFESFATLRIRGEMIDALRSLDWVPRTVRDSAREIEGAESSLATRMGRPPSEAELAGGLGVGLQTLRKRLLEIADSCLFSFDSPLRGSDAEGSVNATSLLDIVPSDSFADPQDELGAAEGSDLSDILSEAIAELPEREQFILSFRYREDMRLGEIAEVLGLGESRVSQLHAKALISLRAAVSDARRHANPQPAPSCN